MQFTLPLSRRPDLDAVHDHIQRDDAGKWDVSPARKEITLCGGRLCLPPSYEDDCPTGLTPTLWATSQFCQRLGIPTPYFKRCPPQLRPRSHPALPPEDDAPHNGFDAPGPSRNGRPRTLALIGG